jgi:hypothetical protein
MTRSVRHELCVEIDLNNPKFQSKWDTLEEAEQEKVIATFKKITQLTWNQIYKDNGLKWEKIISVKPPNGIDSLYSFRISKSIRAIGYRDSHFLRVLLIQTDHDATYGKK